MEFTWTRFTGSMQIGNTVGATPLAFFPAQPVARTRRLGGSTTLYFYSFGKKAIHEHLRGIKPRVLHVGLPNAFCVMHRRDLRLPNPEFACLLGFNSAFNTTVRSDHLSLANATFMEKYNVDDYGCPSTLLVHLFCDDSS